MNKLSKIITTLFLIVFAINFSIAQTTFVTNEVRQYMSKGEQNGIEIILNGTNVNDVKDALKKWSKKKGGKYNSSKKSTEIFIDDAKLPLVSANTIDIYAIIVPVEKGSKLIVFSDLGGAFITSYAYASQYAAMDAEIKEFAQSLALENVSDQLKTEEKFLKTINKDLKKLQKEKEKSIKEIEKAKKTIAENESDIIKNDADQTAKQQQISLQQQIIETIKSKKSSLKR